MASFEERFYLENPTLRQRIGRDLRLLGMLFLAAGDWLLRGGALRRRLRRGAEPIVLDDLGQ